MLDLMLNVGVILLIAAIACTQIFLLFKYFMVRRAILRMQETSSGDHQRYKNGGKNGSRRNGH